jgi:Na+-driven multidrug efflux pump
MRVPAKQYLTLRAIGCPAVVVSLAVQGVFRGFKDTRTPLFATGEVFFCYLHINQSLTLSQWYYFFLSAVTGNVLNMVLVPILMFTLGYGVRGSAIATVISQ